MERDAHGTEDAPLRYYRLLRKNPKKAHLSKIFIESTIKYDTISLHMGVVLLLLCLVVIPADNVKSMVLVPELVGIESVSPRLLSARSFVFQF